MAIVLDEQVITTLRVIAGRGTVDVSDAQEFKIETSPGGQDVYRGTPPQGTRWIVSIVLNIEELPA